jgi:hypothetical protein
VNRNITVAGQRYYRDVLAGYWPARFGYVEHRYRTLPFPFDELTPPEVDMQTDWELEHLVGFLASWSATQRYRAERGQASPAPDLARVSTGLGHIPSAAAPALATISPRRSGQLGPLGPLQIVRAAHRIL